PQHRSDVIAEIKRKLSSGEPIRVISTQLVEAGVDIDFPVVYRAMAGLDSIAQAAGRCNREGRLGNGKEAGKVVVFVPPRNAPMGLLRKASETTSRLLESGIVSPTDHKSFSHFFSELYWKANSLDAKSIMKLLAPNSELGIQFRSAADAFKIIDDSAQRPVLVPYEYGATLIRELRSLGPERWLLRKLQRYTINIYTDQFNKLRDRGSIDEASPGIFVLTCDIEYKSSIGLLIDELPTDPNAYIG
ncbi:MAG TPA: CRISPR-associated helicase/endonuclease Cas3, partial [Spirochaetales bacterium]|nr:CRISPR-associated helicase/endonuclease Cas3 [Spirochaetales bacterium]